LLTLLCSALLARRFGLLLALNAVFLLAMLVLVARTHGPKLLPGAARVASCCGGCFGECACCGRGRRDTRLVSLQNVDRDGLGDGDYTPLSS
jgi:hypothetical protein